MKNVPNLKTVEHLVELEIMGLNDIIILQNKVDCVKENKAVKQYEAIRQFIKGTRAEAAPIVPISAQLNCNIDCCDYIVNSYSVKGFYLRTKDTTVRSFDVNKPAAGIDELKGGVTGRSLLKGVLKLNQIIEIRPGILMEDDDGNLGCRPIILRVVSLYDEQNKLELAVPVTNWCVRFLLCLERCLMYMEK
ncbi:Eukaryotic translation initiation factor 2 subunit 3, putative [Theobroma cacao]|uniref:Eukaryotic translation initiation factor 2 subunit 3, putative n=1 Tax=Theobroma cacao TaxID=3641 RepID=A0A061FGR6_THECC|nr:Eukaryotic translation initiation factor 2 subunit 3, putative [Theobroma cacao]